MTCASLENRRARRLETSNAVKRRGPACTKGFIISSHSIKRPCGLNSGICIKVNNLTHHHILSFLMVCWHHALHSHFSSFISHLSTCSSIINLSGLSICIACTYTSICRWLCENKFQSAPFTISLAFLSWSYIWLLGVWNGMQNLCQLVT
jgi:hypothetical protein